MTRDAPASQLFVTTDVVMFTINERKLKLLLVMPGGGSSSGRWRFPGGFVGADEGLDECAMRTLQETTGIAGVYLEQLYTFGRPRRGRGGRVISVAYYALAPMDRLPSQVVAETDMLRWFALDALPALSAGTGEIIAVAQGRLASKLDYSTIAFQFMPEGFALSELQAVYEIILGGKLDKRNFRKRVLGLGCIEETGTFNRNGSHRPARLYRLKYPDRVEIIK